MPHWLWLLLAVAAASPLQAADPENGRGEVSDPFLELWDHAVAAMDQAYGDWQQQVQKTFDSTQFTIDYLASVHPDSQRRLDPLLMAQADANRDQQISREEAQRFLEIQLGLRWETGDLLRLADGRLVNFARFLELDQNGDSQLSPAEIDASELQLTLLDRNQDGFVSLAESIAGGALLRDPIAEFRDWDTNRDGLLNREELTGGVPPARQHLILPTLRSFDDDGDGALSLPEYQLSMLGNFNYPWDRIPVDQNRDRRMSFQEFSFHHRNLFQLQRRFYFHRYDVNGDRELATDEFPFATAAVHAIYRMTLSPRSPAQPIYRAEQYPLCSSPDISPDSQLILFDAQRLPGDVRKTIRLMTIDGNDARDLCDGSMPTWSADGSRFVCTRQEQGSAVWIMKPDGSADLRIDDGRGGQWSPDGNFIAYTHDNDLRLYDVRSGEIRTVLAKGTHPYRYLFGNMAWSPDSRMLAFKGRLDDQHTEIAMVTTTGKADVRRRYQSAQPMADDLAWLPSGDRILFDLVRPNQQRRLIHSLTVDDESAPIPLDTVDPTRNWISVAVSRDGKHLVLITSGDS